MHILANRHWIIVCAGEGKGRLSQNCIKLLFTIIFVSNKSLKQKYNGFYLIVRIFGNPKCCFMNKFEEARFNGCKRNLNLSLNLLHIKLLTLFNRESQITTWSWGLNGTLTQVVPSPPEFIAAVSALCPPQALNQVICRVPQGSTAWEQLLPHSQHLRAAQSVFHSKLWVRKGADSWAGVQRSGHWLWHPHRGPLSSQGIPLITERPLWKTGREKSKRSLREVNRSEKRV